MKSAAARIGVGVAAGVVASFAIALAVGATDAATTARDRLVPEDASGHLHRVAIHYVPAMDDRAMPIWKQLFAKLPSDVEIEVAVTTAKDFDHFTAELQKAGIDHLDRFHASVVGKPLTTWSRDRMASLEGPDGGGVLSPPKVPTVAGGRMGDWDAPFALARDVYGSKPKIAEIVFEGGDLAASGHHVFADANLIGRNLGRGDATVDHLESVLQKQFAQEVVFLGDHIGEVPEHHIMMYMMPLDDTHALVGDVRSGMKLASGDLAADPDVDGMAARFDRVAELLEHKGFEVTRIPVVVLPGKGSYVTYTNALFDTDAAGKVVYLPTYAEPALDKEAQRIYEGLGYRVVPIDVSSIYTLNGSLGCLVNVMARD